MMLIQGLNQSDRRVPTASSGVCAHSVTTCQERRIVPEHVREQQFATSQIVVAASSGVSDPQFVNEDAVVRISKELNEPKWLLRERLKAFWVFSVLSKSPLGGLRLPKVFHLQQPPEGNFERITERITTSDCTNARSDSLYSFLNASQQSESAKSIFMNRFFKPDHSLDAAFINAFFTEVNFFSIDGKNSKANGRITRKIKLKKNSGVSIDFLILPDGAELELDIGFGSKSESGGFHILEAYVGEGASLSMSSIHKSGGEVFLGASFVEKNARCKKNLAMFSSANIDNRAILVGNGCEYSESGVFTLADSDKLNFNSVASHLVGGTTSDISVRGVLNDSASAIVDGMAKIFPNASKSTSRVSERVLLLDSDAHAVANPRLEILNNDVIASHSASIGEIDEEQIFYLMSRGISRKDVESTLVEGFLGSNVQLSRL